MPGGAGQGTVGKRNGREPLSDAPLQRLGEKSITRSPFVLPAPAAALGAFGIGFCRSILRGGGRRRWGSWPLDLIVFRPDCTDKR